MGLDTARREASRVAAHVDLRDVRLFGVNGELIDIPADGERLSYKLNADVQVQHEAGEDLLVVFGSYLLTVRAASLDEQAASDEEGSEPESDEVESADVVTIAFEFNALFAVERQPDEPFTESELTAFGQTTGQFALYPYAREFVATLTGRMGLPPLHMGVMRLMLEGRDD